MTDGRALPVDDPTEGRAEEGLGLPPEHEKRMTRLFRRWPSLTERENSELRVLWRDRIRRARRSGSQA